MCWHLQPKCIYSAGITLGGNEAGVDNELTLEKLTSHLLLVLVQYTVKSWTANKRWTWLSTVT